MKDFSFFSHNPKKIIEINQILRSEKLNIYNLNSFKAVKEPKENGNSFSSNAKIKSKFGYKTFKLPCFADDSGFCVEALNNGPGIKSKRFFEKHLSKKNTFDYILSIVKKKNNNKAFFETAICLTIDNNHHIIFSGKIKGVVSLKPRGKNGFGYDPIFIPENYNKTFAEMSIVEKNKISHRQIAITKLKSFIL